MGEPKPNSLDEKEMKEDDSLLSLSLGSIFNPATARARSVEQAEDCSPVTPTMPIPVRPVVVLGAPFVAATAAQASSVPSPAGASAPAAFASSSVVQVTCNDAFVAATDVLRPTGLVPSFLPQLLLPSDGNGAVPIHGDGNAAPPTQLEGVVQSATSHPSKRPTKRLRVAKLSSPSTASDHATNNGQSLADDGNDVGSSEAPANGEVIESAPFPWATNRVAVHYSLAELSERGITAIEGEVQCKRCDVRKMIAFDIRAKFKELSNFIVRNIQSMDDRAPPAWKDPILPDCDKCGQKNSLRPVISAEKEKINWMFLLLGQTLGLCTLEQLKHFCARTKQHRTGAKDRVLHSTYMELCNQLYPDGPFDMASERRNRSLPFA